MSDAKILDGIATLLWSHVGGDPSIFVPDAADEAAAALVALYEEANGVPLAELAARFEQGFALEHATRPDDAMIGAELAARALRRAANRWGVMVPWFEMRLVTGTIDEGEIEWEGGVTRANHSWTRSEVQSLLFDRKWWTVAHAKSWAREHGYKYGSVDETDRYVRVRQFEPKGVPCRTITFSEDDGIKAVVCAATQNPIGDRVEAVSGPARGQRGVVRGETARVADVELDSGRRVHLERSALRTRGR